MTLRMRMWKKISFYLSNTQNESIEKAVEGGDAILPPRISKKKKLKINIHRPVGTRVVFDDQGNTLPPLAMVAGANNDDDLSLFDKGNKVDKVLDHQRRRDKRIKEKMKWKRVGDEEEEGSDEDIFGSGGDEGTNGRKPKRWKIYFNSDSDDDGETRG
ncbi:unnamed protein product [Linum tenue]|uniref:Uncharacterized protein n=1 Tax=Linum tenue TaxID=586396 RepID=A0AAV0H4F6_9ROSI|nr:unnamed protein product [Linum tenue]